MERNWKTFNYITGESPKEMFERAVSFLETLDYTKDNLVISHWGIINCIISYFVSGTLDTYWKFKVDNCSIVIFEEILISVILLNYIRELVKNERYKFFIRFNQ